MLENVKEKVSAVVPANPFPINRAGEEAFKVLDGLEGQEYLDAYDNLSDASREAYDAYLRSFVTRVRVKRAAMGAGIVALAGGALWFLSSDDEDEDYDEDDDETDDETDDEESE